MSFERFVGARDGSTPERVVTLAELDAVEATADSALARANVKPDWNASGGAEAEILNRPAVVNDLTSSSTTDVLAAAQGLELANRIHGLGTRFVVADITARNALADLTVGDLVTVEDRGDGKWSDYLVAAVNGSGQGTSWTARLDEDALAGAAVGTNLSFTRDASGITVVSSTGANTTLPAATASDAGITTAAQYSDLRDRARAVPIPGDDSTTTFTVSGGYTDAVLSPRCWDVTAREYVGVRIQRAGTLSASWTVGPFQVAPSAGAYQLHVIRG